MCKQCVYIHHYIIMQCMSDYNIYYVHIYTGYIIVIVNKCVKFTIDFTITSLSMTKLHKTVIINLCIYILCIYYTCMFIYLALAFIVDTYIVVTALHGCCNYYVRCTLISILYGFTYLQTTLIHARCLSNI